MIALILRDLTFDLLRLSRGSGARIVPDNPTAFPPSLAVNPDFDFYNGNQSSAN